MKREEIEKQRKAALRRLKTVEPRNYWNTSGKNREFFHAKPNPNSVPLRDENGKIVKDPKNPWWIDSKDDQYDFWIWLDRNSNPDGSMDGLQQNEIAKLLGCSATKVHFIIKNAIEKLKDNGLHWVLLDYIQAEPEMEDSPEIDFSPYVSDDVDIE
jgi:hypothetical protein